ncbi:MAG TPA: MarR family transcriptional regulator [Longimicrobiaceae bacterium]|nr:MarR family transcriptional regulator [Longimicrobiaceae bacterium]
MAHDADALRREIRQTRPFLSEAQEAAVAILRTADVVRHRIAATVEPYGVTLQQYNVLRILRGAHPDPLATLEIGERLIERTPGMTRLLDRLEEKGLVRRERCSEDRRQVLCRVTEAGLGLLASMDEEVDRADAAAVRHLAPEEMRSLLALLQKVRRGAGS